MDSRRVSTAIRKLVRPALEAAGFDHFTSRTAWRYSPTRIEVVNFQSFNRYHADTMRCTPFSFALNLGVFLINVPPLDRPPKRKDGRLRPEEYECPVRRRLRPGGKRRVRAGQAIWRIDPAGANVDSVVEDARAAIESEGLPWFEKFRSDRAALRVLLEDAEDMGGSWGFGAPGSPVRLFLIGHLAAECGERALAIQSLRAVLEGECFQDKARQIRSRLRSLER